jgi:hypothetical protein
LQLDDMTQPAQAHPEDGLGTGIGKRIEFPPKTVQALGQGLEKEIELTVGDELFPERGVDRGDRVFLLLAEHRLPQGEERRNDPVGGAVARPQGNALDGPLPVHAGQTRIREKIRVASRRTCVTAERNH